MNSLLRRLLGLRHRLASPSSIQTWLLGATVSPEIHYCPLQMEGLGPVDPLIRCFDETRISEDFGYVILRTSLGFILKRPVAEEYKSAVLHPVGVGCLFCGKMRAGSPSTHQQTPAVDHVEVAVRAKIQY